MVLFYLEAGAHYIALVGLGLTEIQLPCFLVLGLEVRTYW